MDPLPDPGAPSPSPPPPPPPPRSYAAASALSAARQGPPPLPPKPKTMSPRAQQLQHGTSPIAPTTFFGPAASSSPIPAPAPDQSSAFRPPASTRRPAAPAPVRDRPSSPSSDDELRLTGAPVAPVKKRSPAVIKTYGSTGPRRASAVPESGAGAGAGATDGGQPWDDEWMQPPPEPPSATTVWRGAARWNTDAADVRVVRASPSPPPPPPPQTPPAGEQRLLEWAPAPQAQAQGQAPGTAWPIGLAQGQAWTVPRVLTLEGERALVPALWDARAWDFDIAETPAGHKAGKDIAYRAMGEWVPLGAAGPPRQGTESSEWSQVTTVAAEDTPMAPAAAAAAAAEPDGDKQLPAVEDGTAASSSSPGAPPPALPPKPTTPPPPAKGFHTVTRDELAAARPHPHLYFCSKTFSWVLFAPVLRAPASAPDEPTLWHAEPPPVDPSQLGRYFSERFCALSGLPPIPVPIAPADRDQFSPEHDAATEENAPAVEALGALVELQAHEGAAAVAVSGTDFFPTVIPRRLWARLMRARGDAPAPSMSPDEARWEAARLIWRTIDNGLFAGETRAVSAVSGKSFNKYMPWDSITNDIFVATLGFRLVHGGHLSLPHLDAADEVGRTNRARLVRCWLEVGLWMEDFVEGHADKGIRRPTTRITLKPARPALAAAMGGDHLPRAPQTGGWSTATSSRAVDIMADDAALAGDYTLLGATPDLADRVIARAYDLQRERDWTRSAVFLEALVRLGVARASPALQEKVALERSLGRYPASEVVAAFAELRLGDPFKSWHSEEDISAAFERRNAEVEHKDRRRVLLQQARIVADFADNQILKALLESMGDEAAAVGAGPTVKPRMDLDAANRALGIETDMDDSIISTLYEIRLADASTDAEKTKMREALEVIADARNSSELRTLAKTGQREEAGWQAAPTVDTNLPVGLTNIANTCYLNSLLQYFFTVRELRDTILAFHDTPTPPSQPEAQLRVGGRLVSLAEVKRSKRFVALLQTLYRQLIHAPVSAVTPETELAYLALVPSKEEADAAIAAAAVAPTVQRMTEEPEPLDSGAASEMPDAARSPTSSSMSVLGKRKNGSDGVTAGEGAGEMQVDTQAPALAPLSSPSVAAGGTRLAGLSLSLSSPAEGAGAEASEDAEMADGEADEAVRRAKRGKSEEGRSGASSATEVQRSPAPPEVRAGDDDEAMPVEAAFDAETEAAPDAPPRLPRRRTPLAPSPEPPAVLGAENGGKKEKEQELERQVSTYMAFGRQNDVTECMDNVMFQVEAALLANAANGQAQETASLLRRTFYGRMRQQLVFDDPTSVADPVRTQDEPFSSLLVDVAPSASSSTGALARDIYDGLDAVFAPSPITLEGHAAQRRVALVAPPPPVLQIQLQRVQYDREKQTVYKSNAHMQFYEEIGVGRYVEVAEGDDAGRERQMRAGELRAELERTRERLAQLIKDKSTNTSTVLRSTSAHFSHLASLSVSSPFGLPTSLLDQLNTSFFDDTEAEAAALEAEIDALQRRVAEVRDEISRVWSGAEAGTRYELTAVFIHRGTALSGHYYIYQRDHRNPERWLRYNDSVVSEVDKDEVFREMTGDTNAYFLAYVRKDCRNAIESIKREP